MTEVLALVVATLAVQSVAETDFARELSDTPWPNWGRVDVQAWLGQVLAKKGDQVSARAAYEKGLATEPDHRWIRDVLLRDLERQQRKK